MEFFLFFMLALVGGTLLAVAKAKREENAKEKARNEWDSEQGKYEKIICLLPSDLVSKLFDLLKQSCAKIRLVVPDTFPEELSKILLATNTVINNGTYGTITGAQHEQIKGLLDKDFTWLVNEFIPAANKALRELADSDGLGFGLITNSAADAMLHSALDTNERLKGNEKKIREYEQMIDQKVIAIFDKIQQVLENPHKNIEPAQMNCEKEEAPCMAEKSTKRLYLHQLPNGTTAFIDDKENVVFPDNAEFIEAEALYVLKYAAKSLKVSEIQAASEYLQACRVQRLAASLRNLCQAGKIERFDENNFAYFKMK